jgi:hypothetical protein
VRAAYLGDLKVLPAARGGRALLRLASAAESLAAEQQVGAAFSVVMDGTRVTPTGYTGRVGIPAFRELGKVTVLRIPTGGGAHPDDTPYRTSAASAAECYRRLSRGRYAAPAGAPAERSALPPVRLVLPAASACGLLEDTALAKRLIADDGAEMSSAHLSDFAFRSPADGAELLRVALGRAARQGYPALFVALAEPDAEAVRRALGLADAVAAPATVFGTGLRPGAWAINTSEV